MAGSSSGNAFRTYVGNHINYLFDTNYTNSETDFSGTGTIASAATEPGYLYIDLAAGASAGPVFVPDGYGIIENVNDTGPIIGPSGNSNTPYLAYLGDASGQTFYAGNAGLSAEFIAMTGFGNLVATPTDASGVYTIAMGLISAGNLSLAAAVPGVNADGSEQGNTVAAGGGQVSIAAGLGANQIFLGSGLNFVASEGNDTIVAGTGAATISAGGDGSVVQSDAIFQGSGALTFFGSNANVILGGTVSAATALIYGGSGALLVVGGTESATVYGGSAANDISGGSNGNNLLVAGSGSSSSILFGGGSNDTLVGAGASDTIVAGTGNETLFGSASGSDLMYSGAGTNTIVLGGGTDLVYFGTGSDTVYAGTGIDSFGYQQGATAATDIISGFNAAVDLFQLYSTDSATSIVGSAVIAGGNTTILLGNTSVELLGVTNLTTANFTGGGLA